MNSSIRNEYMPDILKIIGTWERLERSGRDMTKHDNDVMHTTVFAAVFSKLQMAKMDIVVPDALIILLITLTNGNPGQSLLLFKEILQCTAERSSLLSPGYVIKLSDVLIAFGNEWPIMEIPEINEKYHKKWLDQKMPRKGFSDNRCDTPEYWREVYYDPGRIS